MDLCLRRYLILVPFFLLIFDYWEFAWTLVGEFVGYVAEKIFIGKGNDIF